MAVPYLQLIEQGVEVVAQLVELGNRRFRDATVETTFATGGVGHAGQPAQWANEVTEQAP
ncbi:hypothetical protein D3C76_1877480 [compost metagenome]